MTLRDRSTMDMPACTIAITLENLAALLSGELEPTTGFMMGRFRVSGDMSAAMKLQRLV